MISEKFKGGLQDIIGEKNHELNEGSVIDFQKKKASGVLAIDFVTIDEKGETHPVMTGVEPLLDTSGYWTWRKFCH